MKGFKLFLELRTLDPQEAFVFQNYIEPSEDYKMAIPLLPRNEVQALQRKLVDAVFNDIYIGKKLRQMQVNPNQAVGEENLLPQSDINYIDKLIHDIIGSQPINKMPPTNLMRPPTTPKSPPKITPAASPLSGFQPTGKEVWRNIG